MAMRSNLTLLMTDVPSARYSDFASKPFRLAPIPIEPAVAQAETHESKRGRTPADPTVRPHQAFSSTLGSYQLSLRRQAA